VQEYGGGVNVTYEASMSEDFVSQMGSDADSRGPSAGGLRLLGAAVVIAAQRNVWQSSRLAT